MLRQNKKPLGGANAADGNCSPSGNKNKGMQAAKRNDMIFYIVMLAFPLVQFAVMYVGVNTNVILLAFKSYDSDLKGYFWSGFVNFSQLFSEFSNSSLLKTSLINSLKVYAVQLFVSVPLCLLFSYYIFKKMAFSNFFKIFLFLPSVISSIVMTMIFKYFVEKGAAGSSESFFRDKYAGAPCQQQNSVRGSNILLHLDKFRSVASYVRRRNVLYRRFGSGICAVGGGNSLAGVFQNMSSAHLSDVIDFSGSKRCADFFQSGKRFQFLRRPGIRKILYDRVLAVC